jgi:hypothetical protein
MTTIPNVTLTWKLDRRTLTHDLYAGRIYIGWVNHRTKWGGHLVLSGNGDTRDLPLCATLRDAKQITEAEARIALNGDRI